MVGTTPDGAFTKTELSRANFQNAGMLENVLSDVFRGMQFNSLSLSGVSLFSSPKFQLPVFFETPMDVRIAAAAIAQMANLKIRQWHLERDEERMKPAIRRMLEEAKPAIEWLVGTMRVACGNDGAKMAEMLKALEKRGTEEYGKNDIFVSLLMIIEEQQPYFGEPKTGGAGPSGGKVVVPPAQELPLARLEIKPGDEEIEERRTALLLIERARKLPNVRIVPLREMLRIYFEKHPQDYEAVLRAVLGLSEMELENSFSVEAAVKKEIDRAGEQEFAFRLAEKLRRIKGKKKLDEFGSFLDEAGKVTVICPRCYDAKSLIAKLRKVILRKK